MLRLSAKSDSTQSLLLNLNPSGREGERSLEVAITSTFVLKRTEHTT